MLKKVNKRDEYGRPVEFVDLFDEETRKIYGALPQMKPIKVGRFFYCSDCGTLLNSSWNACPHCLSRISWGGKQNAQNN